MRDDWNDAFGDCDTSAAIDKGDSCVAPVCNEDMPIGHLSSPICEVPKSPSNALPSKDDVQASKEPSPLTENSIYNLAVSSTPVPSPVNRHGKCDVCPSVSSVCRILINHLLPQLWSEIGDENGLGIMKNGEM
ncbi:unnamed protein product, partial [Iphiclides podalirius]